MPKKESYSLRTNRYIDEPHHVAVLFAGESQTKPSHMIGPKVYDYYLLHFIVSGKGTFFSSHREYELTAGDSFLIEPGELVSYRADASDPWYYRWIALRGEDMPHLLSELRSSKDFPVLRLVNKRSIAKWFDRIQQSLTNLSSAVRLETIGYVHLLFATYWQAIEPASYSPSWETSKQEAIVQQAIHVLTNQYAEDLSIEHLAQQLGYNRAYLSRIFKQVTSVTPVTFLLRTRVDKARYLMREHLDLTIEQIASSAGFRDALYFSKQFRRFYQMSPSAYRSHLLQLIQTK